MFQVPLFIVKEELTTFQHFKAFREKCGEQTYRMLY